MRIVTEFNLGPWKCTLFSYQSKFTLKIEQGTLSQEYKWSIDGQPDQVDRIIGHFSSDGTIKGVAETFELMKKNSNIKYDDDQLTDEFDLIVCGGRLLRISRPG